MAVKIKLFKCQICGLRYEDEKWAKKCEAWCKKYKSYNIEIIKHAINKKSKN